MYEISNFDTSDPPVDTIAHSIEHVVGVSHGSFEDTISIMGTCPKPVFTWIGIDVGLCPAWDSPYTQIRYKVETWRDLITIDWETMDSTKKRERNSNWTVFSDEIFFVCLKKSKFFRVSVIVHKSVDIETFKQTNESCQNTA